MDIPIPTHVEDVDKILSQVKKISGVGGVVVERCVQLSESVIMLRGLHPCGRFGFVLTRVRSSSQTDVHIVVHHSQWF